MEVSSFDAASHEALAPCPRWVLPCCVFHYSQATGEVERCETMVTIRSSKAVAHALLAACVESLSWMCHQNHGSHTHTCHTINAYACLDVHNRYVLASAVGAVIVDLVVLVPARHVDVACAHVVHVSAYNIYRTHRSIAV